MGRPRCCGKVGYETANSSRLRPNGEPRYYDSDRCLNLASYVDKEGDYWCWLHIRNPHVEHDYGPFKRISDV